MAIVAEAKARGHFVEKLMAAVALNNIACIVLFEVARSLAHEGRNGWAGGALEIVGGPALQLVEPLVLGLAVGGALVIATRDVARSEALASISIIAILFTAGLSEMLEVSPLLSCLFLGIALGNLTPDKDEIGHRVFRDFEGAIFAVFFTLAGMELDFGHLAQAAVIAGLFVCARIVGKYGGARIAMTLTGAEPAVRKYLGLALIPQAGVAIGLVLVVQADEGLADVSELFLAVGITAVAIAEVVGPLTTRFAIARSGDAGKDRAGLIGFLEEKDIVVGLGSLGMDDAVERLTDHLFEHHEVPLARDAFLAEALAHDGAESYLGHGLAIAHVALPAGEGALGVMGVSPEGFEMEGGPRVHCVLLIATPPELHEHRNEVSAAFSLAIGKDPVVAHELFHCRGAEHAYRLLHEGGALSIEDYLGEPG